MRADLRFSAKKMEIAALGFLRREAGICIRRVPRWVWWAVAVAIVLQIYFFQELVAAYLIFSVLFGCALILIFAIYLLSEVGDYALQWIEVDARAVAKRVRQQWIHAEAFLQQHARDRKQLRPMHHIWRQ